ncbi:aminotransferase class IV [Labedaea rhizosphaerae]|uniref:Branched-subunit amino acid aminotransferase/4-amino-4-deoxychorismate lyase n=1 Tax=Labedaea rhizosphaerae TaxID=598644 RepID=A0A4R6RVV3_LABRH|nr:aminotransferase class IV [Labedaea rhizosphaerae]TDP91132.1 branched-subunit amino acid aminotransferase/4-amino-4-deoxychorismate lyase [Labedaea rhizosphaerae]
MRYLELNGEALPDDASRLIPLTYGHFTAMQVRGGAVAGWPLHLARLAASSREMFGAAVPDEQVHALAARALAASGLADASMRIMMVPPAGGLSADAVPPDVVVVVADPVDEAPGPALRVCSQVYERELPHVKHLATMGLTRAHRLAVAAGFDDALFVDRDGLVLEGSIYNVAFWDGEAVVWPQAPMLTGIMMQLVQGALTSLGVPQRTTPIRLADVSSFRAAFFTNSQCARQPIASLDDVVFPGDDRLWSLLASMTFASTRL